MAENEKATAASGPLLPTSEYELPILSVLVRHGGRAPVMDVLDEVGHLLEPRLTEADRMDVAAGFVVWKNRSHMARMNLIRSGDMSRECSDHTWGITEQGRRRLDGTSV